MLLPNKVKTKKEMKEFVDNLTEELEGIIEKRGADVHSEIQVVADVNDLDDLKKLTLDEILYYIQCLKTQIVQYNHLVEVGLFTYHKFGEASIVWEAQKILNDWQKLHEHLEQNPSVKEEWEALLMAIKLTEDE